MAEHNEHSQRNDFNEQTSNFSREQLTSEERLLHDLRRTHHREARAVTRSLENVWQRLQAAESRPDKQAFSSSSPQMHPKMENTRKDLLNMQTAEKRTLPPKPRYSWLTVLAAGLMVALLSGTALGAFLAFRQARLHTASSVLSMAPTPQPRLAGKAITGLAWSPGGQFFAVADAQGNIGVWKVSSGKQGAKQWQINVKTKIWSLAWSPDGVGTQRLALACDDGKVRILDAQTGKQLFLYTGHGTSSVLSVAWSADYPHSIGSGDFNGSIHVWDPETGKTQLTFSQSAPVTGLAWGGIYLIAVGAQPGGTYTIWDTVQGFHSHFPNDRSTATDIPNFVPGTLTAVSWEPDATYIAIGDSNGNLRLLSDIACSCWGYEKGIHAHHQQINSIAWSTSNQRVATASDDGTIHLWNVIHPHIVAGQNDAQYYHTTTITPGAIFTNPDKRKVTDVVWSPDSKFLLSGDEAGNIYSWAVK